MPLGIVAVIAVAYTAGSWYVGKEAQTAIVRTVDQANERFVKMLGPDLSSAHLKVEIRDYHRGVFSSTAHYVIHTVDSEGKPLEYVLQDDLQHGPFPLAALSDGKFKPMLAYSQAAMVVTPSIQKWFDLKQGQTPLRIESQIGFDGQGVSHWTLSPFETASDEDRISFSGGHVRIVFSDGFNNNVATGHFDHYTMTDTAAGEKLEVRDIGLDSNTKTRPDGEIVHQSKARVKSLAVTADSGKNPAVIEDLVVDLSSAQKGGMLDARLEYDFARVLIDGNDLGKMKLGVALNRFNVDALSDLQTTYGAMVQKRGPDAGPDVELTEEEQAVLQEKMRPILAAGPSLAIDPVSWKNSAGESTASAFVQLRDPGEIEDVDADELARKLITLLKLDLAISRPMIVQAYQQVAVDEDTDSTRAGELGGQAFDEYADLLAEAGLMKLQDDVLILSLEAVPAEDRVTLNGETVTTEQLMMLGLGLFLLQ